MPEAPYTETITLNYDDHPVIIFATTDNQGNPGFQFNVRGDMRASPQVIRGMLSLLGRCAIQWYVEEFSGPPPLMGLVNLPDQASQSDL